jgi:hypothetical protein
MPIKATSKDGVKPTMAVAEANVPIHEFKPMGFKETAPGIMTHAIGEAEPSVKSATERMGAAKPWMPKGGHAVAAANAHDPAGSKPSMKVGKTQGQSPAGYAGADQGGYAGAGGVGGYE